MTAPQAVLPAADPAFQPAVQPVTESVRRIAQIPGGAAAVGPFSQAVAANGFAFTAGQIPAISGLEDQPDTFEDQVRQDHHQPSGPCSRRPGPALEHVVKVNGYLTDPGPGAGLRRRRTGAAGTDRRRRAAGIGAGDLSDGARVRDGIGSST